MDRPPRVHLFHRVQYLHDMSSAGHVMDMIARMRANALRRRNPFDRKVELNYGGLDPELFRPLTEVQLAEIRSKATAQRRH